MQIDVIEHGEAENRGFSSIRNLIKHFSCLGMKIFENFWFFNFLKSDSKFMKTMRLKTIYKLADALKLASCQISDQAEVVWAKKLDFE